MEWGDSETAREGGCAMNGKTRKQSCRGRLEPRGSGVGLRHQGLNFGFGLSNVSFALI